MLLSSSACFHSDWLSVTTLCSLALLLSLSPQNHSLPAELGDPRLDILTTPRPTQLKPNLFSSLLSPLPFLLQTFMSEMVSNLCSVSPLVCSVFLFISLHALLLSERDTPAWVQRGYLSAGHLVCSRRVKGRGALRLCLSLLLLLLWFFFSL